MPEEGPDTFEEPGDVSNLESLDSDRLLQWVDDRFRRKIIYSYVGESLIAVNPCEQLSLYSVQHHEKYTNLRVRSSADPHLFWVADNAYRSLLDTHTQCIVVTGDSGSGKTESTKLLLKHLVHVAGKQSDIVEKLTEANSLLELFGNAATRLNHNSSRFGKLIELEYNSGGDIHSAKMECFILEEFRVTCRHPREKNFHVFYSLFAGMSTRQKSDLLLENEASQYRILQPASVAEDVYKDQTEFEFYKKQFHSLEKMLRNAGFSSEEILHIYQVMSAVLHVANISFDVDEYSNKASLADDESGEEVIKACQLLGLDNMEEDFMEALVSIQTLAGAESMTRYKGTREAEDGRDALARELYAALFYGITDKINSKMELQKAKKTPRINNDACIRLLDIFGFENLQHNGFEQLLINAANEKIHQFYLHFMIQQERQDYADEGVDVYDVTFKDNSEILSLIFDKPSGIIPLVDDEVSIPKSTDETFLLKNNKYNKDKEAYKCYNSTIGALLFGIIHYAGEVVYDAESFLKKNSSTLPNNLRDVVQGSTNVFVYEYFSSIRRVGRGSFRASLRRNGARQLPLSRKSAGKLTGKTTDHFQNSLRQMMSKLKTAKPHFVRCIKPNIDLKPAVFDSMLVKQQLQSSGILEVAAIRKYGYPVRIEFQEFSRRYADVTDEAPSYCKDYCLTILQEAGISDFRFGNTKVFLKMHHKDKLESVMKRKMEERKAAAEARKEAERSEKRRVREALKRKVAMESGDMESIVCPDTISTNTSGQTSESSLYCVPGYSADVSQTGKSETKEAEEEEEEGEEEKEETSKDSPLANFSKLPAFNAAMITEREFENDNETEMKFRRIFRAIMYVLVFLLVLVCGSSSRISLIWLAKGLNQAKESYNPTMAAMLMMCQGIPLLVSWLSTIIKTMFGRKEWPTLKGFLQICVIDTLQTVARSVLLFRVLPWIHPLQAVVLCLAVCQVPAVMQIITAATTSKSSAQTRMSLKQKMNNALLILSLFIQLGALALFLNVDKIFPIITSNDFTITERIEHLRDWWWTIPLSVVFVTIGWWENFAHGTITLGKRRIKLKKWRKMIVRVREASFVYSGFVQIFVCVAMAHVLLDKFPLWAEITKYMTSITSIATNKNVLMQHFETYGLMYIQIASTFLCIFSSGLACRLYMQRFAFALPIILVPVVSGVLVTICYPTDFTQYLNIPGVCETRFSTQDLYTWFTVLIGTALWISYIFLSKHIWYPKCERMAKMNRLFTYNHRDPVFPDQSLVLGRRNDELENHSKRRPDHVDDDEDGETLVYICPTLWHETRQEINQLLKSLFRLDFELCAKRIAKKKFSNDILDIYQAEIHVMFDDAFQTNPDTQQREVNSFVDLFLEVMPGAASSIAKGRIELKAPNKIVTPYGGRLEWEMPGGTSLNVHLKDREKIRHKKRWSQIMYMYYLLGFNLFKDYDTVEDLMEEPKNKHKVKKHRVRPFTSMLNQLPGDVIRKAENTFIMCLDGDVDFRPEAVQLLIDRMKKNKKVAAVCGRIHPIGDGPMVWYQQFEYAVGHWLQKAAEHVFGCVLCCPGCFSLFRGSALIDDNVMRMYATEPTEARHYIQYEQGEDRWLCTLLLQQGYKIDYCAGADSFTYAPETFHDFYIQRRRWSPSTLANIVDLIGSWRTTIKMNDNISLLFMIYQFLLLACSILAPGLVVYMIAGSYNEVLGIDMWYAYLLSVIPVLLYIIICLKAKTETQVAIAAVMSAVYAIVMLIVVVGQILRTVEDGTIMTPSVLFMISIALVFIIAGLIHPKEILCLPHGILYYFTVPSTFVFLTVFFLCNMNVVSWGTRESPKTANSTDIDQSDVPIRKKTKIGKFLESLGLMSIIDDLKTFLRQTVGSQNQAETTNNNPPLPERVTPSQVVVVEETRIIPKPAQHKPVIVRDPQHWARHLPGQNPDADDIKQTDDKERQFWIYIIEEYLKPLKSNKEKQEKIKTDLASARNNIVFAYFLINLLFTLLILQFQLKERELRDLFFIAGKYEPLSVTFLAFFTLLVVVQFCGMLAHQWGTFLHLIASTKLNMCVNNDSDRSSLDAIREAKKLQSVMVDHPDIIEPDYDSFDEDDNDRTTEEQMSAIMEEPEISSDENDNAQPTQYEQMFKQRYRTVRHNMNRLQSRYRRPSVSFSREEEENLRRFNVYNRRRYSSKSESLNRTARRSLSDEIAPDYDMV